MLPIRTVTGCPPNGNIVVLADQFDHSNMLITDAMLHRLIDMTANDQVGGAYFPSETEVCDLTPATLSVSSMPSTKLTT